MTDNTLFQALKQPSHLDLPQWGTQMSSEYVNMTLLGYVRAGGGEDKIHAL